ncbi:MAG: nuclear transport factor 2 family protein [Sulfuricurvum sp.]|nr:nuclear transport factor 2 family protein [Sulfuricurvum sp.]
MIDTEFAERFVHEWIEAWNNHDLDAVLSHYSDDFEMSSPFIIAFSPESGGTLRGKDAVGAYWSVALEKFSDLHFVLENVFVGADSLAISYTSVLDKKAVEVFFFDDKGKVVKAAAHYS